MYWDLLWNIVSKISNILCIASVVISFGLWLSFGKFKKEIEREHVKYIEEQEKILNNLNFIYKTIFTDDLRTEDVISALRKQIYSISKKFQKLMIKEDLRCIMNLMKILKKDTDKIDFSALRINLDFIITAFTERSYSH
ncbi:MAG: hypothetical protein FWF92_11145 [Oscillospiraceae bacterium]|nr:hypothetical protein [Oscillospiraceae bacterium]